MTSITTKSDSSQPSAETAIRLFDNWFDPIEAGLRDRVRGFIHAMIEGELDMALSRPRYARHAKPLGGEAEGAAGATGHRHGHRSRSLLGSFGQVEIAVPRARLNIPDGKTTEWKSKALRAYQRRTLVADALIASSYLAGTNTRRVRRALASLFGGAVGKDTVSRVWRKVKTDWDAWNTRSLAEEPIVRLILDGTVVRVRLDRKATSISLLVVIGVREDGQKVLLAIKSMGGRVKRPGAPSSTISSSAASGGPSSSLLTAHRGSTRRLPRSLTACRCRGARFTSTGTCWRTPPSACTRRSPATTAI
jgi:putative transposase